jgi:hypothetical protein
MIVPQLPYKITGMYTLHKPRVPFIATASTPEEAERNREQMELALRGCPAVYRSPNGSKAEKLRHLAILDNHYNLLASGAYSGPSNAAVKLSRHSKDPTFLIVYADVREIKRDRYSTPYVCVYQFRTTIGPNKTLTVNGKTFTKPSKTVRRINSWKCSVEL